VIDHDAGDVPVFESGAIMLYLCEYFDKEHKLLPTVCPSPVQPCPARRCKVCWPAAAGLLLYTNKPKS